MNALPAPSDGRFILARPINPAVCPQCGHTARALWTFIPARGTTSKPVACESCAGTNEGEG